MTQVRKGSGGSSVDTAATYHSGVDADQLSQKQQDVAAVEEWLTSQGLHWLQRLGTPDGEIDWILRLADGAYGVCRLYCPDPKHPVGLHELQGLLELRVSHPDWRCIAAIFGPIAPGALWAAENAGIQVHQREADFLALGD
ncbi:MAG: hypothetical protein GEEBNDBF_01693 [bacterium]|nr:hypothetical protein [bacterium]